MLVVIPDALYGRLGAVLSALIVSFGLIGLTMHKDFYACVPRRDFFFWYTNLSNLLVVVYFAFLSPLLYARASLRWLIPHAEFAVMMCIMLTHVVFHTLLMPRAFQFIKTIPPSREYHLMLWDNLIIHYLVPLMTFAYWLLCSPGKQQLTRHDACIWTVIPLCYLIALFIRAPHRGNIHGTDSPYPYPFLDVKRRGPFRVLASIAAIYAVFVLCGLFTVWGIARLFSIFGGGHALFLL